MQLLSEAGDQQDRWVGGVAGLVVAQFDAAADVDEHFLARGHAEARCVWPAFDSRLAVRRYTTARPPCAGAVATPRECRRSPGAYVVPKSNSRSKVRSVTVISMLANAAPIQRRTPPP